MVPRVNVIHIHCFSLPPGTDHQTVYSNLRQGLALTLSEIPFLGGCVVPEEGSRGRVQIQVDKGYGMRFPRRHHTNVSPRDSSPKSYKELKAAHFPISELDSEKLSPLVTLPTSSTPAVMAVQANFMNEGLLLTTSIHHSASDATALASILKVWAKHTRTVTEVDKLPPPAAIDWRAMDRSPLMKGQAKPNIKDYPELRMREHIEVTTEERVSLSLSSPPRTYGIFYFSPSHLAQLKLAAAPVDPAKPWVSTNDALCALVWRHMSRARGLGSSMSDRHDLVQFACAVQGRRRLSPPMPDNFLGNCVTWCLAELDIESLTSAASPLYNIACTLRSAITRIDSDHLQGLIGVVESVPDPTHLENTQYDDPGRNLVSSSVADMELHQLDWGASIGRWELMRTAAQASTGGVAVCGILPRLADGGLEVILGLETEAMAALRADRAFAQYAEWRCT
ncbi:MAG: hypothetical protein LQ347_002603 [Umbilicaria vellea]|nr:MAG: hypothetical protein LQ347_002603 [Umbilicaria vellea]